MTTNGPLGEPRNEHIIHDEQAMRTQDSPHPKTLDELTSIVEKLSTGQHDYGTCVYAMSLAAVAAFNYVAHELGVTGFQASCADMDILRRTRYFKGPFMVVNGEDALYPQSDLRDKLDEFLTDIQPWLKEQAQQKLAQQKAAGTTAADSVMAHWKKLAQ